MFTYVKKQRCVIWNTSDEGTGHFLKAIAGGLFGRQTLKKFEIILRLSESLQDCFRGRG